MSGILDINGHKINQPPNPSEKINRLIATVEGARRGNDEMVIKILIELLEGGWQLAHNMDIPDMKVMVTTITDFMRDANASLKMNQHGVVQLGNAFLPVLEKLKELSEAEASQPGNVQ